MGDQATRGWAGRSPWYVGCRRDWPRRPDQLAPRATVWTPQGIRHPESVNPTRSPARRWESITALAWVGAMVVFTLTWTVLGFLNDGYTLFGTVIEDYSPVHQPISGLGLGSTARVMKTAFVLYGLTAVAGAVATSRLLGGVDAALARSALITLGLHGVGAILVGFFTLESMDLHSLGFLGVLTPIVGFFVLGRRMARHTVLATLGRTLIRVAAPISVVLLVAFFASFNPEAAGEGQGIAGLTQRALILNIQVWIGAVIAAAVRHGDRTPTTQPSSSAPSAP